MKYTSRQYAEALYNALDGKTGAKREEIFRRFATLLRKNKATPQKGRILAQYEKVYLTKKNLRKVTIESAKPLSAKTKKDIEQSVGSALSLTEKHNPDLIAGITILLDDSLYIDASAKTKIQHLFK